VVLADMTGMYLANQLDGKIFRDPSLLPAKGSYSQFVQTKARAPVLVQLASTCKPQAWSGIADLNAVLHCIHVL
jgi:hypothetical protein